MKYFASLGIFMRQGRGTQRQQNHCLNYCRTRIFRCAVKRTTDLANPVMLNAASTTFYMFPNIFTLLTFHRLADSGRVGC